MLSVLASPAPAQDHTGAAPASKEWGLGLAVGGISGLSGYRRLDGLHFAQGTMAFSMFNSSLAVSGDYGFYVPRLFDFSKFVVAYYGIGGLIVKTPRLILLDRSESRDRVFVGGRIPLGLQFFVPDTPLQLGLELTPGMFIVPATSVFIDVTFLVRFLF